MVGDDLKLKKVASNKNGVVGSNGKKTPIKPSTTQISAQTLNNILTIGLRINIPDGRVIEPLSSEFIVAATLSIQNEPRLFG